jgi:hypothetical protein
MTSIARPLRVVVLALAAQLAGCGTFNGLTVTAVDYNLAVEREHNRLILLNIVRAMHRQPMHFTELSLLRGSDTVTLGLTTSYGTSTELPFKYVPAFGASTSPSFDLAVLSSKEFVRGLLTPFTVRAVDYYWNQGWPRELVFLLFVEKMFIDKKQYDNYPLDPAKFIDFQRKMRELLWNRNLTTKQCLRTVAAGLEGDVGGGVEAIKAGFVVGPDSQLPTEPQSCTYGNVKPGSGKLSIGRLDYEFEYLAASGTGPKLAARVNQKSPDNAGDEIHLRSAEGVLYYVGELARAQLRPPASSPPYAVKVSVCQDDRSSEAPLFELQESPSALPPESLRSFTWVRFANGTYWIDPPNMVQRCTAARTTDVFRLVGQLVAQQRSSEELPSTSAVRLIGR